MKDVRINLKSGDAQTERLKNNAHGTNGGSFAETRDGTSTNNEVLHVVVGARHKSRVTVGSHLDLFISISN